MLCSCARVETFEAPLFSKTITILSTYPVQGEINKRHAVEAERNELVRKVDEQVGLVKTLRQVMSGHEADLERVRRERDELDARLMAYEPSRRLIGDPSGRGAYALADSSADACSAAAACARPRGAAGEALEEILDHVPAYDLQATGRRVCELSARPATELASDLEKRERHVRHLKELLTVLSLLKSCSVLYSYSTSATHSTTRVFMRSYVKNVSCKCIAPILLLYS